MTRNVEKRCRRVAVLATECCAQQPGGLPCAMLTTEKRCKFSAAGMSSTRRSFATRNAIDSQSSINYVCMQFSSNKNKCVSTKWFSRL